MVFPTLATSSPFTGSQHVAMLIATAGFLAGCILVGRLGGEHGVRRVLTTGGVIIWIASGLYFTLWPDELNSAGHIKLEESLPIQACDLLALFAPLALVYPKRWLRAVVYFGAFGMTTQAFITPVIDTGPDTPKFWVFWSLHASILMCAVFDLAVGGFKPTLRDLGKAVTFWFCYAVAMVILDGCTGWYYGYLGPTVPKNAEDSILKHLGDWPLRPALMMGIVLVIFVLLWLPWAALRAVNSEE